MTSIPRLAYDQPTTKVTWKLARDPQGEPVTEAPAALDIYAPSPHAGIHIEIRRVRWCDGDAPEEPRVPMIYIAEKESDIIEGVWLLWHVILSIDGMPVTLEQNRLSNGEDVRSLSLPVQATNKKDWEQWMKAAWKFTQLLGWLSTGRGRRPGSGTFPNKGAFAAFAFPIMKAMKRQGEPLTQNRFCERFTEKHPAYGVATSHGVKRLSAPQLSRWLADYDWTWQAFSAEALRR